MAYALAKLNCLTNNYDEAIKYYKYAYEGSIEIGKLAKIFFLKVFLWIGFN